MLVVDDDRTVCRASVELINQWGAVATSAHSQEEALAAVREGEAPDLMIVDVRLPGETSGVDLVDQMRAAANRDIAALVVTGDTSPAVLLTAYQQGLPLLHKPVPPLRLRHAVEALCSPPAEARHG